MISLRQRLAMFRESLLGMTRGEGGEDIEGGLRKFLDIRKGGSEKLRGAGGGGALKICILQNQQHEGGGGRAPKELNR